MTQRILTFNHHESYLSTMAALDAEFDVVVRRGELDLSWSVSNRRVPENFRLIQFDDELRGRLRSGYYDWVICHTLKNLVWMFIYFGPRYVFVAHIPLFFDNPMAALKSCVKKAIFKLFRWTHRTNFLAVSEFKRSRWFEAGDVVVLAPKEIPEPFADRGYDRIAVVCNDLAQREEELGLGMINELRKDFTIDIIGQNPGITDARIPKNYDEFVEFFRSCRIYLYTIRFPLGDGYNTAMLEAMRMGMAIVTVPNPSSPIEHNRNGLVGDSRSELADHLRHLMAHPEEVDRLGKAAQATIAERFTEEAFLAGWRRVLGL